MFFKSGSIIAKSNKKEVDVHKMREKLIVGGVGC